MKRNEINNNYKKIMQASDDYRTEQTSEGQIINPKIKKNLI